MSARAVSFLLFSLAASLTVLGSEPAGDGVVQWGKQSEAL